MDAAGGCNWLLKLLRSSTEAWQHAGAALVELYASTGHGRARMALRVEELGGVVHVLCALLGQPCKVQYTSQRRGRKSLQVSRELKFRPTTIQFLRRISNRVRKYQ